MEGKGTWLILPGANKVKLTVLDQLFIVFNPDSHINIVSLFTI
jgi:hypothetical protein